MFDQYAYFEASKAAFPEVEAIHRISGLRELEETLEQIRNHKDFMMLVEDDDDGYLNLEHGNNDNGFRTFYIVGRVKVNDSANRKQVQNQCKTIALKIFKKLMGDAQNFGDPAYGFDRSRVDYRRVGPLVNNYHGYSFSYIFMDENFNLG